ncbi:MAG: DNA recombination protein RmuC [Chitinophagaceae bacterium]|nr:DNA recombination protein RmuC [Chitinophagaceae bacterium]
MESVFIISLVGVASVAAIIGWLLARAIYTGQLMALQEQVKEKQLQALLAQSAVSLAQLEREKLVARLASAETQLTITQQALDEARANGSKLSEQLKLEMAEIADTLMKRNSQQMAQSNEEKIGEILKPLKAELGDFKKKVEETYEKESKERFSLGKEIDKLVQMSAQVSQEANNLTLALKGNVKMQGNWGEMILETILEHSGLTRGREYVTQEFIRDNAGTIIKDDQGHGLQPDVIISYPDQRKVIIDSKVSLIAWDQYVLEAGTAEQERALKNHIQSVRAHIDGLSKKNYPKYARALDYVLLFIPIEPAFLEAVKTDTQLWKYAYDKKIMLVSPTNLLAVLKIIADLWKVELQNKNAIEIAEKAGLLYDKFCGFLENLETVGKKIGEAQSNYDNAFKQLSTGRGNIIGKIEELKKMGANAGKQLPDRDN